MRLLEMRRGGGVRVRVQVDQAQPPRVAVGRRLFRSVHEGRIQLELGHVQMADVGVQVGHLGARGLVFLDQTRAIVDAVDPAPDAERDAVARDRRRHRHFPPVAFAFRLGPPLRADAFRGGGAGRVAIVDVATTMDEGRQVPDRDRGGRCLGRRRCRRTGHLHRATRTGKRAARSLSIHRFWSSRSRSFGPFTSTNSKRPGP